MKFRLSAVRATLLTATALGCVVAACIGAPQAQAQFVCIGNPDGALVPPGAAFGGFSTATGISSMACGTFAAATGDFATATSANATANGLAATATGENSLANGTRANATGAGSIANGENATAVGTRSTANGANATALGGPGTLANADAATAVGQGATVAAGATGGSAFGQGSTVSGANGTAIGTGAVAAFAGSTAIGAGAVTTAPNQMMFGTASSTYVAPGITSVASKAAQSGPLQIVTSDANGNLATNTAAGLGLASSTDINAINSQLSGINARVNDLDGRTTKALNGVSMAFAIAGTPWLLPTERFAVSSDWGTFQGTNALALNAAFRLSTNVQANGGLAYGTNGGGVGGRAGVRVGW
jgi:trimeric autotransporter adhesin